MLGSAVLVVVRVDERAAHARDHPAAPLTDAEAAATAVDAALDITRTARLSAPAGAYSFQSCNTDGGPPYRVVVNMTFTVPQGNPPAYLSGVARAMTGSGWTVAATPAPRFGHKLTTPGLTSTFYRTGERTDLATMTVDGECRVVSDHGREWIDLTERLRAGR